MEWWNTTTSHSFASQKNNVIGPSERIVEYFTKAQSPVEITLVILETSNFFPKFSQLPQLRVLNFPKKKHPKISRRICCWFNSPNLASDRLRTRPPGGSETAPEPLRKVSNWIVWRNSYGKRQQQNGYNTNMYTWIYLRSCTYLLIL